MSTTRTCVYPDCPKYNVHIERCARELMAWTWFVGDVTFNVGVEFAMAVAVGINQYLNKNWLKIAIREALGHLKIDMPTHNPLAMDQLNDIFSHVKKTLLCLKKTQGAGTDERGDTGREADAGNEADAGAL